MPPFMPRKGLLKAAVYVAPPALREDGGRFRLLLAAECS